MENAIKLEKSQLTAAVTAALATTRTADKALQSVAVASNKATACLWHAVALYLTHQGQTFLQRRAAGESYVDIFGTLFDRKADNVGPYKALNDGERALKAGFALTKEENGQTLIVGRCALQQAMKEKAKAEKAKEEAKNNETAETAETTATETQEEIDPIAVALSILENTEDLSSIADRLTALAEKAQAQAQIQTAQGQAQKAQKAQ